MIIYNVACTMDKSISEAWKKFFLEKHLDDVVNTGCFTKWSFRQLISDSETEKVTFVSEYHCPSMADFERYNTNFAPALKAEVGKLFKGDYFCQRCFYELLE